MSAGSELFTERDRQVARLAIKVAMRAVGAALEEAVQGGVLKQEEADAIAFRVSVNTERMDEKVFKGLVEEVQKDMRGRP